MTLQPQDLIVPDWPAPKGVGALITTRTGGVSTGACASLNLGLHVGDDPMAVAENRRRVMALLPGEPCWLNQVHGVAVHTISAMEGDVSRPEADAAVTRLPGRPCAVLVADCLPVLFCSDDGDVVAAAHAGWRGLAAGVLERTVEAMNVAPQRVMAYLGPAIGAGAFEVGQDVVDAFAAADLAAAPKTPLADAFRSIPGRNGKYLADIFTLARHRMAAAGVARIFGGGLCTVSAPARFFSYRRDGRTGRMAAIIWREKGG